MKKNERGITLIALVITIIVLLILAGVSIATLTGQNGILKQADNAKIETRGSAVEEARNLWKSNEEADKLTGTTTAQTLDELLADLEKQNLLTTEEVATIKSTGSITIGSRTIEFGTTQVSGETLVGMLKKAETDNCLNLDGSCTNPEHLHIGDYVDYKNPTSGTYTVTPDKYGNENDYGSQENPIGNNNQVYDVAKNQLNWRVLGIDEATGGLKLIAGSPMKLNDIAGKTDSYLYLGGAEAYEYGPRELDNIGALYKNEYAQSARSVKIEDINSILGIKTDDDIKNNNKNYDQEQGILQYGEQYGPFENQYTPNSWLNGKQAVSVEGKVTSYMFGVGDQEELIKVENTRAKDMLFDNLETKPYFLASNGVAVRSNLNMNVAFFGIGQVMGGDGIAMITNGYQTFESTYSEDKDNIYGLGVRPIVVLKSDTTKNEVPRIPDKTEE